MKIDIAIISLIYLNDDNQVRFVLKERPFRAAALIYRH